MNGNKKSFSTGVERVADAAIKGLQSAMPAGVTQLTVGKVTYTIADLVKLAEGLVKPWKDSRAAHAVIRQIAETRPEDHQKLSGFLADLKISLSSVLGRDSEELTTFGFIPQRRRKQLTAQELALRAAKAKLTRGLRHTQGSRQKADLKAETPTIEISPDGAVTIDPPKGSAAPAKGDSQAPGAAGMAA
jgi:hypothetical protein